MFNPGITELIAFWGKAPLKINPYQCLPLRYPKSGCRSCVENCAAGAIEIKETHVKVADDRCTGCGVCSSLCPTGVFEMTNFEPDLFVEKAQRVISEGNSVRIECYKVPYSERRSLRIPCLGHITPGLILRLVSTGTDEIIIKDAGICEVCEAGCGDRIAAHAVSQAMELLKGLGLKQRVSIVTEVIPINSLVHEGKRLKDYKEDPELSRREIFSMFKKEAKKGIAGIVKKEIPQRIDGRERVKKSLPSERGRLLKEVKELSASKYGGVVSGIFHKVAINSGCDMCRLCSIFCPTDALAVTDTEKEKGIVFSAATCIGCGLCVDVCLKKVLALDKGVIPIEDILREEKTQLIRFEKIECAHCGRVFSRTSSEELCDTCMKEGEALF